MAQQKILIRPIRSEPLSVVIECVDLTVREGDATEALSVTIFTVGIFIDVVSKVDDIVNRVLAGWIAVGVEETEGEIAARVDGKGNLGDEVVGSGGGFRSAQRAFDFGGAADAELIVILGVRRQA